MPSRRSLPNYLLLLVAAAGISSCSLITFDCGGATIREVWAHAIVRDASDTIEVEGFVSEYEERGRDGSYLHQIVVTLQAPGAAHYDTIPTALRPHIKAVQIEFPSHAVAYRASISNNTSQGVGPPVLADAFQNDMQQSVFDSIHEHILAGDLVLAIETDSPAIVFPKTRLLLDSRSYDWRATSGCK